MYRNKNVLEIYGSGASFPLYASRKEKLEQSSMKENDGKSKELEEEDLLLSNFSLHPK